MTWQKRALQYYVVGSAVLFGIIIGTAFKAPARTLALDDLTVKRIHIVDSAGKARLEIAGNFPPRRNDIAGILFNNSDGGEAGGLIYRGARNGDHVDAGAALTFDQYNQDEVVVLSYDQVGTRKQEGLSVSDRPDTLGPALKRLFNVLDTFPPGPRRDSTQRALLAQVPREQLAARRVFVGRDPGRAAVLSLADRFGTPRLRLTVDSAGNASIAFLDTAGHATRVINGTP